MLIFLWWNQSKTRHPRPFNDEPQCVEIQVELHWWP